MLDQVTEIGVRIQIVRMLMGVTVVKVKVVRVTVLHTAFRVPRNFRRDGGAHERHHEHQQKNPGDAPEEYLVHGRMLSTGKSIVNVAVCRDDGAAGIDGKGPPVGVT